MYRVAAGLCLGSLLPCAAQALEQAAFVALGASVLKVEAQRQQGGYALGSAVVVGEHKVVTNCHVTHDARAIHLLVSGERLVVAAQAADVAHDLCVLQVPALRAPALALGRAAALQVGQAVTAVGYTGGIGIQAVDGVVVALNPLDGAPVVQSSNWFTSGASGGALLDQGLHLVGILTFRLRGGESHYFSAPVEWLDTLLEGDYAPVAPITGSALPYWQREADALPAFLRAARLNNPAKP